MAIRDRIHNGLGVSVNDIGYVITLGLGSLAGAASGSDSICVAFGVEPAIDFCFDVSPAIEYDFTAQPAVDFSFETGCP